MYKWAGSDYTTVKLKGLDDKFTEQLEIIFMVARSERGEKQALEEQSYSQELQMKCPLGSASRAAPGEGESLPRAGRSVPMRREGAAPTQALRKQTVWEASREKDVRLCYNHLFSVTRETRLSEKVPLTDGLWQRKAALAARRGALGDGAIGDGAGGSAAFGGQRNSPLVSETEQP